MARQNGPNAATIDAQIDRTAAAVKAFRSPMMIRWIWEMNLTTFDANRTSCWDPAHDIAVGGQRFFNAK